MPAKELNHSRLALPTVAGLSHRPELEVWDNTPDPGEPPHVTLYQDEESNYIELTPTEARALAALLIHAAESQERRG